MKRFWLVMLSLGLVLAFSASAMAVDVKFSGSFYAAGMYQDQTTLRNAYESPAYSGTFRTADGTLGAFLGYASVGGAIPTAGYGTLGGLSFGTIPHYDGGSVGPSTAFYYQRLRVQTDFIVSPGLKLVTRFDAMERIWGGVRGNEMESRQGYFNNRPESDAGSVQTRTENQNIAFDLAYVSYVSPIGLFEVGYQPDNGYGTIFGNNVLNGPSIGKISWLAPLGKFYLSATLSKKVDNSNSAVNYGLFGWNHTDADQDAASVAVIYAPNKDLQIGMLVGYQRVQTGSRCSTVDPEWGVCVVDDNDLGLSELYPLPAQAAIYAWTFNPYAKAKFGPVAVEAEVNYAYGKGRWEGNHALGMVAGETTDIRSLTAYLNAVADLGMFYGGGTVAFVSGDETSETLLSKMQGGFLDGGVDYTPTLIMFNSERTYWAGRIPGYGYQNSGMYLGSVGPKPISGVLENAFFYQGKVGVRPIPALDINASLSYAKAHQHNNIVAARYGYEVDVTATYKITNNLSYMLGAGYLWTGDYYRGSQYDWDVNPTGVENIYTITNKLTLTF